MKKHENEPGESRGDELKINKSFFFLIKIFDIK